MAKIAHLAVVPAMAPTREMGQFPRSGSAIGTGGAEST